MKNKPNIAIIGASGHASVICDIVLSQDKYSVAGFIDKNLPLGKSFNGLEVLGREEDIPELVKNADLHGAIIAIGDNYSRWQIFERIRKIAPELQFVKAIHPDSCVAESAKIGAGSVIMAGVVVNPYCRIGEFCILNTAASLDHDSVMEDYSCLAPGVVTGGNVSIGKFSAVCIGVRLTHNIKIGAGTVVGAGAVVLDDLPDQVLAYGTPARVVRSRKTDEPYLFEA